MRDGDDDERLPPSVARRDAARRRRRSPAAVYAVLMTLIAAAFAVAAEQPPYRWSEPFLVAPSSLPPAAATGYRLAAVDCTSPSLCVAVADDGNALSTIAPSAGGNAWHMHSVSAGATLSTIACPTPALCVAGTQQGDIATSENPGAASPSWSIANDVSVDEIVDVSCPSTSLCVAVDRGGRLLASTAPTGGPHAWSSALVDAANAPLTTVECPSTTLCVALDHFGNVLSSHDPTGGVQAWTITTLGRSSPLRVLSCPSPSFCTAADEQGNTMVASDPASGAGAWRESGNAGRTYPLTLSCPSADRCLATDFQSVVMSDDPSSGSESWFATLLGTSIDIVGLSCPSVTLCVAVERGGRAIVGTGPAPSGAVVVTLAGGGSGRVVGSPLSCPDTCRATLPRGTRLHLEPVPSAGSTFAGWGGACSGTSTCDVTVARTTDVIASFAPAPPAPGFMLSVTVGGAGRVAGAGIACPPTCRVRQAAGSGVELVARPARGWRFQRWGGACRGGGSCRARATSDLSVNALFRRRAHPRASISRVRLLAGRGIARVAFRVSPAGARTRCALVHLPPRQRRQAARYRACRSPVSFRRLAPGRYRVLVRAVGRNARKPATRRFTFP